MLARKRAMLQLANAFANRPSVGLPEKYRRGQRRQQRYCGVNQRPLSVARW